VHDLLGRRIRDLAAGTATAGEQILDWDLRDVGGTRVHSGVYFVRLQLGTERITRSLVVLD